MNNNAIEQAAIAWVIQLEQQAERTPRDTRYQGAPADIESPPRLIEVKAFGTTARGNDLWLEQHQVEEALRNPHFYVYVVENVEQSDPQHFTLKVLGGNLLAHLLERRKEQRYFTVPWPVSIYDRCPTTLDGYRRLCDSLAGTCKRRTRSATRSQGDSKRDPFATPPLTGKVWLRPGY